MDQIIDSLIIDNPNQDGAVLSDEEIKELAKYLTFGDNAAYYEMFQLEQESLEIATQGLAETDDRMTNAANTAQYYNALMDYFGYAMDYITSRYSLIMIANNSYGVSNENTKSRVAITADEIQEIMDDLAEIVGRYSTTGDAKRRADAEEIKARIDKILEGFY